MWCGMGGWNVFLFLYLSRLAGNGLGAEGAGRLEEPLGKLTALQKLDLSCTVAGVFEGYWL